MKRIINLKEMTLSEMRKSDDPDVRWIAAAANRDAVRNKQK